MALPRSASVGQIILNACKEAVFWTILAWVIYNTLHMAFPSTGWPYMFNLIGLITALLDTLSGSGLSANALLGAQALIFVVLAILAGILFFASLRPILSSAKQTPAQTFLVFAIVLGAFVAVPNALSLIITDGFLTSGHFYINMIAPVFFFTVSISGRTGKIQRRRTGSIEVDRIDDEVGNDL